MLKVSLLIFFGELVFKKERLFFFFFLLELWELYQSYKNESN